MTGKKFFIFLGAVFLISLLVYFLTTPRGSAIPLIGVVDGNEVIVSPQIAGRMIKLNVDEGSEVKKGDLIAELDPSELQAALAQDVANIASLNAKVKQAQQTTSWTDEQTVAAVSQARANLTTSRAQLEQAQATLELDEINNKRAVALYESGVEAAQDRDTAVQTLKAARANVQALTDSVASQQAALAMAEANRKQVAVQQADVVSTQAQLQQANALRDQATTQLGYTKIYSPLDGVVSVRVAKQGEMVAQGGPIVVIVDVDHLWVRADVEESYIDAVRFGDKLKVQLPSGDIVEGTVFFKGVESDFATQRDVSRTKRDIRTFAIKVAVTNQNRRLFTGMTATVLLPSPPKKSWFARL
ncbi:MAG: efflux RND transporter periplasmic adaptor subunit [Candidatus Acidiferrales bacterium]|jgi:HlyD family secretion protein